MKKIVSVLFLLIALAGIQTVQAQYSSSIGGTAGKFANGISFKRLIGRYHNTGVDVLSAYTREANGGYSGKIFLVRQIHIHNSDLHLPLYFVYGVGGHVNYFRKNYFIIQGDEIKYYKTNTIAAGVDAKIGFEWNSRKSPLTIGADADPWYSLLNPGPESVDFHLSLRYIIQ